MGNESQIVSILNEILKVEAIEEAFSCIIVHNTSNEKEKVTKWQSELTTAMLSLTPEQQENAIRKFLNTLADTTNYKRMHLILSLLENLVSTNVLPAKMVCECILNCDKLHYQNEEFWVKCFILIRRIVGGVDYKGVREIMKACKEKAHSLPTTIYASVQPQMRALESLIEYIFDRNACLLPSYLIINELQKFSETKNWPHWLSKLVSDFIESFRNVVQMISIVGHSKMLPVVEHSGYGDHLVIPWVLDRDTLQFKFKGCLPYDAEMLQPQTELLRYVLEQPYSRDMVCSMLGLQNKTQPQNSKCSALEEQLVELVIRTMEKAENEPTLMESSDESATNHWLHLSSLIICYVLSQFAVFPTFVLAIHDKLVGKEWKKSRDHLMWVLLQFISGSIQRKPVATFVPFFKLYGLLYPEKEPLPVPNLNHSACTHQMAAVSIWIHLLKKIYTDHSNIHRFLPHNLKTHYEFLQHMALQNNSLCMGSDYRITLLCNAYSTCTDLFTRPMAVLVESVLGTQKLQNQQQQTMQGLQNNSSQMNSPTAPLPMSILDSLTVHVKMSLIHSIMTHVAKSASTKSNLPLPPALVETYSRLLVYTEIESIGIKKFISYILPTVFKAHAWGILYTLLDMFSYRMHHIQPTYRVQILSHLHSLAAVPQTNQTQLHLCVESTALSLITGLGSAEVQPHLSRFLSEPKTLVSADSEELNRALVLTLARSMHITGTGSDSISGTWCKELLNTIMQNTPHSWADHTLQCFPPALSEFFQQNSIQKEEKQSIKKAVEEEYRNWASMSNENDIIAHFSVPNTPPLFLCLLWKMIAETDRINPIVYKILERIGARALSTHLRKFCDYVVFEVSSCANGDYVNKSVDAINDMIWKYHIVTFDRFLLCLALRTLEGNEAQVCFFIIQLLLLKAAEFRNRVAEFVKENSPDHWKQSNWHEKHLAFHRKFPEKFAPEGILDQSSGSPNQYQSFPAYFGNVCLRFLPVFDIVLHRYLEIPQVTKSLEVLLEHLGVLYRFHDRPVTYLYNTLHCYEKKLRDNQPLKKRLVTAILGSSKEIRASNWALSDAYQRYMARPNSDVHWQPELEYYVRLVQRFVETISGRAQIPTIDWRFNEFPNPTAHTLYVACVELMALPVAPSVVANNLLDVVAKGYTIIPSDEIHLWINCIGIIMTSLPKCYWSTLHDRLVDTITSLGSTSWQYNNLSPFQLYNFNLTHNSFFENKYSYMIALAHSVWHHAVVGQIVTMAQLIKEKLQPIVKSEEQLIFVCHLVGPTLSRFNIERPQCVVDLTLMLYKMLEQVSCSQKHLKYTDPICDLFYHIKYMFVGDTMKNDLDVIIRRLKPALQMRLRFITHLSIDEIQAS